MNITIQKNKVEEGPKKTYINDLEYGFYEIFHEEEWELVLVSYHQFANKQIAFVSHSNDIWTGYITYPINKLPPGSLITITI